MTTLNKVSKIAAELAGDETVAQGVRAHSANCALIRVLTEQRIGKGLNQRQIAAKMKCAPSKVCRMEAGTDAQLHWGDVVRYLGALNVNMSVLIDDPSLPAAVRIKHHVLATHKLLEELGALAKEIGEGDEITAKIKQFYGEVLFNFTLRFCSSYGKLPEAGPISVTSGAEKITSHPQNPLPSKTIGTCR